jgi:hypothetical protein
MIVEGRVESRYMWGVSKNETPEGTEYFIRFNFTSKDLLTRPFEKTQEIREQTLDLFNHIREQWKPEQNQDSDSNSNLPVVVK